MSIDLERYYSQSYPPSLFVPPPPTPAERADARPGDAFINEPTVTGSNPTNAAKLGPLGYIAVPATAWTTGQQITVNAFAFNWSGTAWAAGAHA